MVRAFCGRWRSELVAFVLFLSCVVAYGLPQQDLSGLVVPGWSGLAPFVVLVVLVVGWP